MTATPVETPMALKTGLAEMLKGGVIMDVTTADQAKIAEDAGAVAVMALERVPADIRAHGGVAREECAALRSRAYCSGDANYDEDRRRKKTSG